jgi:hypothetical protein
MMVECGVGGWRKPGKREVRGRWGIRRLGVQRAVGFAGECAVVSVNEGVAELLNLIDCERRRQSGVSGCLVLLLRSVEVRWSLSTNSGR